MRVLRAIGWFALGTGTIVALVFVAFLTGHLRIDPAVNGHQIELASLVLAAATLVVTAVGVVVALGAVIGYTALKEEIVASSQRAADEAAAKVVREVVDPFMDRVKADLSELRPEDRTGDIASALSEPRHDAEPSHD